MITLTWIDLESVDLRLTGGGNRWPQHVNIVITETCKTVLRGKKGLPCHLNGAKMSAPSRHFPNDGIFAVRQCMYDRPQDAATLLCLVDINPSVLTVAC